MFVGIDIGSTATKIAVFKDDQLHTFHHPTGWSGADSAQMALEKLQAEGIDVHAVPVVATGYGRISVPYANKQVTEITCHGKGITHLFDPTGVVIDIGGQDTKVIQLQNGMVIDFIMNDKCSAGTGKFLEIMATRLGVGIDALIDLATEGDGLRISSMCTVFAESEIISFIGRGESKANIADAIVESVLDKVISLVKRSASSGPYFLSGGLCEQDYLIQRLGDKLGAPIAASPDSRYAGAIGAALIAKDLKK